MVQGYLGLKKKQKKIKKSLKALETLENNEKTQRNNDEPPQTTREYQLQPHENMTKPTYKQ